MRKLSQQIAIAAGTVVVFTAAVLLLTYSRVMRSIEDGNQALARQDYAAAESAFTSAEGRIANSILPVKWFGMRYRVLVFNEARLYRATRRYIDLAHLLERIAARRPDLANDPEYHFWTGIVEYSKASSQTDKQAVRAALERASESFRLALAAAGGDGDWDAKYNYELTARLLAGMRKKEDAPEKMNRGGMKILREDPDHPKEQQQKLAPDKQS